MARCEIQLPEDFIDKINTLSDKSQDMYIEALEKSSDIIKNRLVDNLRPHDKTGELSQSIKATVPKKFSGKEGAYYTVVRPTGTSATYIVRDKRYKRKTMARNMVKLAAIEYGVRGKIAPKPVLAKTLNSCRSAVESTIDEIITRTVGEK